MSTQVCWHHLLASLIILQFWFSSPSKVFSFWGRFYSGFAGESNLAQHFRPVRLFSVQMPESSFWVNLQGFTRVIVKLRRVIASVIGTIRLHGGSCGADPSFWQALAILFTSLQTHLPMAMSNANIWEPLLDLTCWDAVLKKGVWFWKKSTCFEGLCNWKD